MRRKIIVLFWCLFTLALTPALAAAPAASPPATPPNRGALFKVVDGAHTLYLFGTMHVGAPDFYPLEPRVMAALGRSSKLALEIDPSDQAAVVSAVRRYGVYHDGSTALAQIRAEFRPRLEQLLQQFGIAPASVAPMKPWMLASVLAVSEFESLGYQSGLAVDGYLARQAKRRGIPVVALESAALQMALFNQMTLDQQCRFLEDSIGSIDERKEETQARELTQAWRTADAAAFEAQARAAAEDTSVAGKFVQQVLLEQRNPGLAAGIARLLASETDSMAAIGVLHLVGRHSVPELLRQRGLRVERLY